jgi:hypothetical protein
VVDDQILLSLVNSVYNVEFVYLILLGINGLFQEQLTKAVDLESKQRDHKYNDGQFQAKQLQVDQKSRQTKLTFKDVQIDQIEKWDVLEDQGINFSLANESVMPSGT